MLALFANTSCFLFPVPMCALCRRSLAPTRNTSLTVSSGTRGKSVANQREYLELPSLAIPCSVSSSSGGHAVSPGLQPAFRKVGPSWGAMKMQVQPDMSRKQADQSCVVKAADKSGCMFQDWQGDHKKNGTYTHTDMHTHTHTVSVLTECWQCSLLKL